MIISANSWRAFYAIVAEPTKHRPDIPQRFASILLSGTNTAECKETLHFAMNTIVLVITVTHKVRFLHQFHWDKEHATNENATNALWCLLGTDDNPPPITLPDEWCFHDVRVEGPTWTDMITAPTAAAVRALAAAQPVAAPAAAEGEDDDEAIIVEAPNPDQATFTGKPMYVLSPSLAASLIQADSDDPAILFLAALQAIRAADIFINSTIYQDQPVPPDALTPTFEAHKDLLVLLWGAANRTHGYPAGVITDPLISGRALNWAKSIWEEKIMTADAIARPAAASNDAGAPAYAAYEKLATAIERLATTQDKGDKHNDEDKESKKTGFHGLPEHLKRQWIICTQPPLADEDFDFTAGAALVRDEPLANVMAVMKSKTQTAGKSLMDHYLQDVHNCNVEVQLSLVRAIQDGVLKWNQKDAPGPFSILALPPISSRGYQILHTDFDLSTMRLESEYGRGLSKESIAATSKTIYVVPTSVSELQAHLKNMVGVLNFMYGPEAVLTTSVYSFAQDVVRNMSDYKLQQAADYSFCTQLCFRVDKSIQIYLQEASKQTDVTGRPCPTLMSFASVQRGVKLSDYHRAVRPAAFSKLLNERHKLDPTDRKRGSDIAENATPRAPQQHSPVQASNSP